MAVRLSRLKADKIRAKIPIIIDGVKDYITVYNPKPSQKKVLIDFLKTKIDINENEEKINITTKEALTVIYKELTDIELDTEEDIMAILNNPVPELTMVSYYINEIIHELILLVLIEQKEEMEHIRQMVYEQKLINAFKETMDSAGIKKEDLEQTLKNTNLSKEKNEEI